MPEMELYQYLGHSSVCSSESHVVAVEGDEDDGGHVAEDEEEKTGDAGPVDPDDLDADDDADEEEDGEGVGCCVGMTELMDEQVFKSGAVAEWSKALVL